MVASVGIEPTTPRFSVLCSANWAMKPNKWRFVRDLNPWSLAWQASVITTTPTNHGCGSRIWTNNLWVMSPASYQIAPSRDIYKKWRRKRDSNPCADFSTSRFSRPVPSTRLGYSSTVPINKDYSSFRYMTNSITLLEIWKHFFVFFCTF